MNKLFEAKIRECSEQIQEDLLTLLDDSPETTKDHVCQIVVDNINNLINLTVEKTESSTGPRDYIPGPPIRDTSFRGF